MREYDQECKQKIHTLSFLIQKSYKIKGITDIKTEKQLKNLCFKSRSLVLWQDCYILLLHQS